MGNLAKLIVIVTLSASFAARADLPCGITVGPPRNNPSSLPALDTCSAVTWALPGAAIGAAVGAGASIGGGLALETVRPTDPETHWGGPVLNSIGLAVLVVPVAAIVGAAAGLIYGLTRDDDIFTSANTVEAHADIAAPARAPAADVVVIDTDDVDDPAEEVLDGIDHRTPSPTPSPTPQP